MIENKLNGKSSDIISENVKKLKQLFPEIVSEEQINFDMLEVILTGGGGIVQAMNIMNDINLHGLENQKQLKNPKNPPMVH